MENTHKKDSCEFINMVNGMLAEFQREFGKPPLSLCMGMALAEHLWEHLKEQTVVDVKAKGSMTYRGVPIRILGFEDTCFAELEVGQIPQFRKLLKSQEAAARADMLRMLDNNSTNH